MSEHSERQRVALLKILAFSDELPSGDTLAELLGCRYRSGARYYLERLESGGMLTVSEEENHGLVVREITMTDAAWHAIGESPPPVPKVFRRCWRRTSAGLRVAGKQAETPQPEPEERWKPPIHATLRPYYHDWDGDGFRAVAMEEARRRATRLGLTTGGHKPQHLGIGGD